MAKKEYSKNFISGLIKKEIKIEIAKISQEDKDKGVTSIANLTIDQAVKIAKSKRDSLSARTLKNAVKQVIGTANSMTGILVENKKPKEVIKEINEGKWDNSFQ